MPRSPASALASVSRIESAILPLRGQRILLDEQLAALYGVQVKALIQAVRRNRSRFPADFMFQLTRQEAAGMRSQSVTASRRNLRFLPYAFTEQGVAMLSSVLRSRRAVQVNIEIMRAFVRLRRLLAEHADLARRLQEQDARCAARHRSVARFIEQMPAPPQPRRRIGFREARIARLTPRPRRT